jgi:3'-phosphoadenosine 5'-phosphosulfate sulfotransferase (PAPS reductase)/FAD synthetase
MRCVVFFSGGLMSWAAAKRAVAKYGADNTTLLFTDTLIEDADLYRFLEEAARNVGAPLVRVTEGRDPWQVFHDEKLIGNTRADPCSKILKREPGLAWLKANCDPADTVLVFGIHHEEEHRLEGEAWSRKAKAKVLRGVRPRYRDLGWPHVEAPMCDAPYMRPNDIRAWARLEGLRIPRLYDMGFSHNNCGGFCVKAGEGHFAKLLTELPEVYAHHEAQEEAFNAARPGKRRQTVLAPELPDPARPGKVKRVPMSLREFREGMEAKSLTINLFNTGGCGCFLDEAA